MKDTTTRSLTAQGKLALALALRNEFPSFPRYIQAAQFVAEWLDGLEDYDD